MQLGWLSLLSFLLSGGGNDFLDYVPTKTYWEIQSIEPTPQNLLGEITPNERTDISPLIDELSSADAAIRKRAAREIVATGTGALHDLRKATESPDAEVAQTARGLIVQITREARPRSIRRLMAIRTLGEMKEKQAAAPLKVLLDSGEPFVAEYAQRSLASINGKTFDHQRPTELIRDDLWLLPEQCAVVGQLVPTGNLAIPIDQAVAGWKLPGDETHQERTREITEMLLATLEASGNIRVDSVTFGVSGDISEDSGFAVALFRGEFDIDSLTAVMRDGRFSANNVDGVDVFYAGPELAMFLSSNDQIVVLASPTPESLPLKQLIAATREKKGGLKDNADLVKLIGNVDRNQLMWAVAKITPELKALPMLGGLDTVIAGAKEQGHALHINIKASGTDPAAVQKSADDAKKTMMLARNGISSIASFMPPLKPLQECFNGAQITQDGTEVSVSATLEGPLTPLLVFSMMPFTTPLGGENRAADDIAEFNN